MSVRLSASDKQRLVIARGKLLRWFSRNGRSFFWRKIERNPYRVLVTEFMLQQTQTFRVEEYLPKFLKRFPTVRTLAKADPADVITLWQGLGYNRRAINLHRAAKTLVDEFGGTFPRDEQQLLSLPGVGEYTSRALQVFAFGKHVSVVDVNVIRVLSRMTRPMSSTTHTLSVKDIHLINTAILPQQVEKWHEALMDLGATICKSRPHCTHCPVKTECASHLKLSNTKHVPLAKHRNEKMYFGKPKRIWRGQVLKIMTRRGQVTSRQLAGDLTTLTIVDAELFRQFIQTVADELSRDGLCTKRGAHYTLKGR